MTIVGDQNILRLEIPMVDSNGVAKLNGIQKLQENVFGQAVVAYEMPLFGDIGEQVTFRAILDHHICAFWAVQNSHERNHIGMLTGLVMESNFCLLETSLSGIQSMLGKSLHGVELVRIDVDSLIHNAIGPKTKN